MVSFELIQNNLSYSWGDIFSIRFDERSNCIISLNKENESILNKIMEDDYFNDKTSYTEIGKIKITLKDKTRNEEFSSCDIAVTINPSIVIEGGVDMGGDIVVG